MMCTRALPTCEATCTASRALSTSVRTIFIKNWFKLYYIVTLSFNFHIFRQYLNSYNVRTIYDLRFFRCEVRDFEPNTKNIVVAEYYGKRSTQSPAPVPIFEAPRRLLFYEETSFVPCVPVKRPSPCLLKLQVATHLLPPRHQ